VVPRSLSLPARGRKKEETEGDAARSCCAGRAPGGGVAAAFGAGREGVAQRRRGREATVAREEGGRVGAASRFPWAQRKWLAHATHDRLKFTSG
jgi:hypothetical protein